MISFSFDSFSLLHSNCTKLLCVPPFYYALHLHMVFPVDLRYILICFFFFKNVVTLIFNDKIYYRSILIGSLNAKTNNAIHRNLQHSICAIRQKKTTFVYSFYDNDFNIYQKIMKRNIYSKIVKRKNLIIFESRNE